MEPTPKRRIPRLVMVAVPVLTLGLAMLLVSVAWRSNKSERAQSTTQESLPPSQPASDSFVVCTDCHGNLDKVFQDGKLPWLLYTHEKHFSKGVSDCSVCHPANTHEPDHINKPTMSRCFMCHGTEKSSIAPGQCSTCHPQDMPKIPPSHLTGKWLPTEHSKEALIDQFECLTCHQQTFCDSCHGVTMPHPEGWGEQLHPVAFFENPSVCQRCHPRSPQTRDFCDSCHHPQGPKDVPWRQFHPNVVKSGGAFTCFQCHSETTCSTCHVRHVEDFTGDKVQFEASMTPTPTPSPAPSPSGG